MAQRSADLTKLTCAVDDVVDTDESAQDAWNAQIEYVLQRHAHWRRPSHDRRRMRIALGIAVLLHVLFLLFLREQMRAHIPPEDRHDVIQIRLLTLEPRPVQRAPDSLATLVVRSDASVVSPDPTAPIADTTIRAQTPAVSTPRLRVASSPSTAGIALREVDTPNSRLVQAAPRLYGVDGRLLVPADLATKPAAPGPLDFVAPRFVSPLLMQHRTPLPYESTRFNKDWTPDHETRLGEFVRKNTHTVSTRTPWGGQITCTWMLFMGGCGFGYAPPNPEGLKRMRENPPFKPALAPPGTQRSANSAPAAPDSPASGETLPDEPGDLPPIPAN